MDLDLHDEGDSIWLPPLTGSVPASQHEIMSPPKDEDCPIRLDGSAVIPGLEDPTQLQQLLMVPTTAPQAMPGVLQTRIANGRSWCLYDKVSPAACCAGLQPLHIPKPLTAAAGAAGNLSEPVLAEPSLAQTVRSGSGVAEPGLADCLPSSSGVTFPVLREGEDIRATPALPAASAKQLQPPLPPLVQDSEEATPLWKVQWCTQRSAQVLLDTQDMDADGPEVIQVLLIIVLSQMLAIYNETEG
jgi:hypothetical protein